MRRFSQRNSLVTLADINITPLLDLAFVLLIIFVITTPLLDKGLPLKLTKGGTSDEKIERKDIRVLEITARGEYSLEHKRMPLATAVDDLVRDFRGNPNLVLYIRADKGGTVESCRKRGITRYSFRTEDEGSR